MIENYFNDRRQHINSDETYADNKQILTGVPQGSILGPFFSCFKGMILMEVVVIAN